MIFAQDVVEADLYLQRRPAAALNLRHEPCGYYGAVKPTEPYGGPQSGLEAPFRSAVVS